MDVSGIESDTSPDQCLTRLTAIAAEMAGHDVDRIETPLNGSAREQDDLWPSFATRAGRVRDLGPV